MMEPAPLSTFRPSPLPSMPGAWCTGHAFCSLRVSGSENRGPSPRHSCGLWPFRRGLTSCLGSCFEKQTLRCPL